MCDVNGISVGEKGETLVLGQSFEKIVGLQGLPVEGAVPSVAKFVESQRAAEAPGQMQVPVVRGDAAFLPIVPARVGLNCGPDFVGGKRDAARESAEGARDIEPDQDAPDVKNNGAKRPGHLPNARGG